MESKYDYQTMKLPDTVNFNQEAMSLLEQHKDWIINWNRSFFQNPENNIDEYIIKLTHLRDSYASALPGHNDLLAIVNFRLNILDFIRSENT